MYIVAPFVYSHVGNLKPIIKISIITVLMTAIVIDLGYTLKYPRTGDFITEQHAKRKNARKLFARFRASLWNVMLR